MNTFLKQQQAVVRQLRQAFLPYLHVLYVQNKEQLIYPAYFCFAPLEIIEEARECEWFVKSSIYGGSRVENEVGALQDVCYVLDDTRDGMMFVTGSYFDAEEVTVGGVKIPRAKKFEVTILRDVNPLLN